MAIEIVSCPIHSMVDLSMVMLARLPEANIGLCSGLRGIELSNNTIYDQKCYFQNFRIEKKSRVEMETGSCRWDPSKHALKTGPSSHPRIENPVPGPASAAPEATSTASTKRCQKIMEISWKSWNHGGGNYETGISQTYHGYFWWLTSSSGNRIKAHWDQQEFHIKKCRDRTSEVRIEQKICLYPLVN